jgi:hypothetical protein
MHEPSEPSERTSNGQTEHLTFAEAAARLNISTDAVRMRVRRGKLASVSLNNRTFVLWPQPPAAEQENELRTERTGSANRSAVQPDDRFITRLEDEISFLRAELAARTEENRRKDHIIAGLIERLPVLPSGDTTQDAATTQNRGPQRDEIRDMGSDPTMPAWRRLWRTIRGGG